MTFAHVDVNGSILQLYAKLAPRFEMKEGQRLLPYNPPAVDPLLFEVAPTLPVPDNAMEITFSVNPRPNGAELLANKLIEQIDKDVDAIYAKAIGNRGPEYLEAEAQAKGFAAAGYPLSVPSFVQIWADTAEMTPQQAADDIILQANIWRAAVLAIREQRLSAKAAIRAGDVEAGMAAWRQFVTAIRVQLNLPPAQP